MRLLDLFIDLSGSGFVLRHPLFPRTHGWSIARGVSLAKLLGRARESQQRRCDGEGAATMALSDRLAELARRAKEAEDRASAASSAARQELQSEVEQASKAA